MKKMMKKSGSALSRALSARGLTKQGKACCGTTKRSAKMGKM